jgi:hypothetical protein
MLATLSHVVLLTVDRSVTVDYSAAAAAGAAATAVRC